MTAASTSRDSAGEHHVRMTMTRIDRHRVDEARIAVAVDDFAERLAAAVDAEQVGVFSLMVDHQQITCDDR